MNWVIDFSYAAVQHGILRPGEALWRIDPGSNEGEST
jgi:hypothetical protein